jgi:hypothetical protein
MPSVTFFRNARRDGEIHSGVSLDDDLILESWKNQAEDRDPVLDWFVEFEIDSPEAPASVDHIRAWLPKQAAAIDEALASAARELEVGMDGGVAPFQFRTTRQGAAIEVRGAASRRVRSTDIARHVEELRAGWRTDLMEMSVSNLQTI